MKYLDGNLPLYVDLYSENFKLLEKERCELNKWTDILYNGLERCSLNTYQKLFFVVVVLVFQKQGVSV